MFGNKKKEAEEIQRQWDMQKESDKQWDRDMRKLLETRDFQAIDQWKDSEGYITSLKGLPTIMRLIGICRGLTERVEELEKQLKAKP